MRWPGVHREAVARLRQERDEDLCVRQRPVDGVRRLRQAQPLRLRAVRSAKAAVRCVAGERNPLQRVHRLQGSRLLHEQVAVSDLPHHSPSLGQPVAATSVADSLAQSP